MDSEDLAASIENLGYLGICLTPEQKAALQSSLCTEKSDGSFSKLYFWGKVLGVKDDYFIAIGVPYDEFSSKTVFYSRDCVQWAQLPKPTPQMHELTSKAKGRFVGDPSFNYEHLEKRVVGEGDEAVVEEETISIKEEDRLACCIDNIEQAVRIVPRGAFICQSTGEVVPNECFTGLPLSEANKLSNYMHFRPADKLSQKSLLEKADLDPAIDFMDPISEDIPKGCWALQLERGGNLVLAISLLYLGYVFYHKPGTRQFGSVYFGTGEYNHDLPFML